MKKIDLVVISFRVFLGALVLGGCAGVETMGESDEDATEVASPSDANAESEETGSATSAINGNPTLVSQAIDGPVISAEGCRDEDVYWACKETCDDILDNCPDEFNCELQYNICGWMCYIRGCL